MTDVRTADASAPSAASAARSILAAELLSIGSELIVGETRDTNSGEIARSLTERGVAIGRIQALPDDRALVAEAFASALERGDLVLSTGGLGPTPDDLTREAIAEVCGERPTVDPALAQWLRALWARRGIDFPEMNLKQAWLIPSATAIPNDNGTAPGWWVDRPDGRVVVALPGPPREMRPMWDGWVLPRLVERGLGREASIRTLRLSGIGESQAADQLGESILRAENPSVATYARADAVDVRISAVADGGRSAGELADEAEAAVLEVLGEYVWARGATTWSEAIGDELRRHGWTLATTEASTAGTFSQLLAALPALRHAEIDAEAASDDDAESAAEGVRAAARADVGVALRIQAHGADTAVTIAVATPDGVRGERRIAFLGGVQGRHRAALTAADSLLRRLREPGSGGPAEPRAER